ncbi:uncharacterized protein LOC114948291 isoform X3 [Acropora millepora]|uniref:uncharacterized protein LOC114948291 isoform X3 n=1 Tax=Acropora millepora TaxID=45264 RepID=UPI001CF4C4AE|nr:uncharacterized protein LOC114948291 isoform X3 [Acropora millepora]
MVYCFAPTCGHSSEGNTCKFFAFPSAIKQHNEYRRWMRLIRREDREPSKHSRVCSCHFRDGQKANGPEMFDRNKDKLFTEQRGPPKKRKKISESKISAPSSFRQFESCRIVIDCTDIEVAAPGLMSQQNATYSSYRGMNSFKVIVGVAPNGVITYVSRLYPGSISDKTIVQQSGLLKHLTAGDMILADKGFLIQDIVPHGVCVNIPPFLNNGTFTESEVKKTKAIAKARIHVERANARLKDFKILSFIPSYLRCYADILFQLCAALVNLQFPLIKEGCEDLVFE